MALREPIEFLTAARTRTPRLMTPHSLTKSAPSDIAVFDQFGLDLIAKLGDRPTAYRLNAAILHCALRFEQVRRSLPKREAGELVPVYLRHVGTLYDRWLALQQAEFARPPKPSAATLPAEAEPAPRPLSLSDALRTLYENA